MPPLPNTAVGNGVTVTTTSETTVAATPPRGYSTASGTAQGVRIRADIGLTPGTGAVTCTVKVYRGTSAGTLLSTSPAFTVVATQPIAITYAAMDSAPPQPGPNQYTVTVTMGSASGNTTVNHALIEEMPCDSFE